MKPLVTILALLFAGAAFADTTSPAATALRFDPDVIVIDVDDSKTLMEETKPQAAQPSAGVQQVEAPPAPDTRVIQLDPPPVVIVNRTNHFRIVSRNRNDETATTADDAEENSEQ